jgi:hypothetical protein
MPREARVDLQLSGKQLVVQEDVCERIQKNQVLERDIAVLEVLEDAMRDSVTRDVLRRVDDIAGFREESAGFDEGEDLVEHRTWEHDDLA